MKKLKIDNVNFTYFKFILGKNKVFINHFLILIGFIYFDNLSLNGKPDSVNYFLIKSDAISTYNDYFNNNPFAYEKNIDGNYIAIIKIKFRKCIQGEVFLENINS